MMDGRCPCSIDAWPCALTLLEVRLGQWRGYHPSTATPDISTTASITIVGQRTLIVTVLGVLLLLVHHRVVCRGYHLRGRIRVGMVMVPGGVRPGRTQCTWKTDALLSIICFVVSIFHLPILPL